MARVREIPFEKNFLVKTLPVKGNHCSFLAYDNVEYFYQNNLHAELQPLDQKKKCFKALESDPK